MFTQSDLEYSTDKSFLQSVLKRREKHSFYSEDMQNLSLVLQEEIWNKMIDSVEFDFLIDAQSEILQKKFTSSYKTALKFYEAIYSYIEEKNNHKYLKDISVESAKNFLYLLPTIDSYLPNINIDSDTGYINSTFATNDNGILSALITEKGEIHYSRVSKGVKIYKISGVAKIKDSRDFKKFAKVLDML